MTESAVKKTEKEATSSGDFDHDRVVMLSRRADGSYDQNNPEIIGDKDVAVKAAERQLTEMKVSATDVALRGAVEGEGVLDAGETAGEAKPDPIVQAIVEAHEKAEKQAKAQAASEVDKLHKGSGG